MVVISVIIVLSLIIGIAVFTLSNQVGKVGVTIDVLPSDAKITVDDKPIGTTAYITPGVHTFKATKKGFRDATTVLSISESRNTVSLLLPANSVEAQIWYNSYPDQQKVQSLSDKSANERGMTMHTRFPLIDKLPYIDIGGPFAIDYGFTGTANADIYFTIHDSTPAGRIKALQWIKDKGFNPAELDIRYEEFINPLKNGGNQS